MGGISNLISGGTWQQSGGELASQAFEAQQAQLNRDYNSREAELSRVFSAHEAEKARQFSSAEAKADRDWQERMSNTAYQRAVNDLKASGLNPYLAYNQGGAVTGSGATAQASTAQTSTAYSNSMGRGKTGTNKSNVTGDIANILLSAIRLSVLKG